MGVTAGQTNRFDHVSLTGRTGEEREREGGRGRGRRGREWSNNIGHR